MATYYIKKNGNDALTGLSDAQAWTPAKLASFVPANGDIIYFKRGETYEIAFSILKSAAIDSRITYADYGTGDKAVLTGFKTLAGWVQHSGNIYKVTGANIPVTCNTVTVDAVTKEIGRYPQTGYLNFETPTGRTSFIDTQLTNTPNFTGAEVVIFKSNWCIDRSLVTDHTNNTVTYTSGSSNNPQSTALYKYFFQKSINCLLKDGDWYTDGSTFYMYFADATPSAHVVKAGLQNKVIQSASKNYITIQNLVIEGGNTHGLEIAGSAGFEILNCDFKDCGLYGLYANASTTTTIDLCTFNNIHGFGVNIQSTGGIVKRSVFDKIGQFEGMSIANGSGHTAIYNKGVGNITELNTITNTGYTPLEFIGNNSIVRYNKIKTYPTILSQNDGGGIYTYYGSEDFGQSGIKVHNNIIEDSSANGLYPDNLSNNQEWYNNTVINCAKWGIHMNMPGYNSIHDNTFYNCWTAINLTNLSAQETTAQQNVIENNLVVQGSAGQMMYSLLDSRTNQLLSVPFGTSNNNKFIVSDSSSALFLNQYSLPSPTTNTVDFTAWKALTGKEADSQLIVKDLTKLSIVYNDTSVVKTIALSVPKKDLDGGVYSSEVVLQPFASMILEDGDPIPAPEERSLITYAGKLIKINTGKFLTIPKPPWALAGGAWNDSGRWYDNETWID